MTNQLDYFRYRDSLTEITIMCLHFHARLTSHSNKRDSVLRRLSLFRFNKKQTPALPDTHPTKTTRSSGDIVKIAQPPALEPLAHSIQLSCGHRVWRLWTIAQHCCADMATYRNSFGDKRVPAFGGIGPAAMAVDDRTVAMLRKSWACRAWSKAP